MIVDAARAGLLDATAKLAAADPGQVRRTAVTLRACVVDALGHGSRLFVADYLAGPVATVLQVAGNDRIAALVAAFARLHYPHLRFARAPNPAECDLDTAADIGAEAALLDIETAAAIAIDALDRIVGAPV